MAGQEITGLGSYSRVAAAISQHYSLHPPIGRRRVLDWWARRTLNAAGHRPPEPVVKLEVPQGERRPRVMFDIRQWIAWAGPGWPAPRSNQWQPRYETPAEYNARHQAERESPAS